MPHEEFEEEDTEVNVNLFNHKGSVKLNKHQETRCVKRSKRRQGASAEKKGRANYASGTGQRRNIK